MRTSGRQSAAVILLLATAFVLTAVTTARALIAEREQRKIAEDVIRDDAAIIADDLLRRIIFEFETFAFRPLRSFIADTLEQTGRVPSPSEIAEQGGPYAQTAAPAVEHVFLADFRSRTVQPSLDPEFDRWIVGHLESVATLRLKLNTYQVVIPTIGGRDRVIVYGVSQLDQRRVWGFVARDDELRMLARRAFLRRNVFPKQMGNGPLSNRDVFIRITRGGFDLLRVGDAFDPSTGIRFPMQRGFEDMFGPAVVEVSIARRAVPALIAGGVPRPHVATSILTLLTTAAALIGAGWVRKREKELERSRLDFVAGVSHELRTPLTQIRMFAQTLLLGRIRSDAERRKSLLIIDQETSRLTNLVDNLLFLARGERNDVAIHRESCDLGTVALQAVNAYAPLAESHRVNLIPHIDGDLVAVADEAAMKQVITNLLDNAVKYGPAGQTIDVRLHAHNSHVRLSVDDEGPGIPAGDRETIFDKFFRLDRDSGTHKAGSGIGLAVVREIVGRHNGRCWVESAPGGGARFVVDIPVARSVA